MTISTPDNSTAFGNLLMVADEASGMSDGIKGLFAGFRTQTTPNGPLKGRIEYVTIATTGNSVEFDGILTIRD